jgi:hypothetical protein
MPTFLILDSERSYQLLLIAASVTSTAYGLALMFLGARLYRLLAVIAGGVAGCLGALELSARFLPDYALLHYVVGLLGAGALGLLFYYVSVFLLGAVLGAAVVHLLGITWIISQGVQTEGAHHGLMISYLIGGAAAGTLTVAVRRPFLIIITSVGGASLAVLGAAVAAGGLETVRTMNVFHYVLAGLAFAALSVTGAIVQWKTCDEADSFFGGWTDDAQKPARKAKKSADAS